MIPLFYFGVLESEPIEVWDKRTVTFGADGLFDALQKVSVSLCTLPRDGKMKCCTIKVFQGYLLLWSYGKVDLMGSGMLATTCKLALRATANTAGYIACRWVHST